MATRGRSEDGGLYGRLNVAPGASPAEISQAYRRLAQAFHPDTHPADADAPGRFRAITEAYEVLGDPQRRARYDRSRHQAPRPSFRPAARPGPARSVPAPATIVFIEPAGRRWPTDTATPTDPRDPAPLVVGPLHWEPDPAPPFQAAHPTADMPTLLHALRQFGCWW